MYNLVRSEQTSNARPARYASKVCPVGPCRSCGCEGQSLKMARVVQHKGVIDPEDFNVGVRHKQQSATFGKPDGCAAQSPDQFLQSRTIPFHQTQRGKG